MNHISITVETRETHGKIHITNTSNYVRDHLIINMHYFFDYVNLFDQSHIFFRYGRELKDLNNVEKDLYWHIFDDICNELGLTFDINCSKLK